MFCKMKNVVSFLIIIIKLNKGVGRLDSRHSLASGFRGRSAGSFPEHRPRGWGGGASFYSLF